MDKIKVGSVIYSVEYVPLVEIDGNCGYIGKCSYVDTKIQVLNTTSKERQDETLIHELTHAILFEAGFREHDEDLVERFSKVLTQVLKDNEINFDNM